MVAELLVTTAGMVIGWLRRPLLAAGATAAYRPCVFLSPSLSGSEHAIAPVATNHGLDHTAISRPVGVP